MVRSSGTSDHRWLNADERGSIVSVTNDAGTTIAVNAYDEYGIPQPTNIGCFQYTGQMRIPELSLYCYKARDVRRNHDGMRQPPHFDCRAW